MTDKTCGKAGLWLCIQFNRAADLLDSAIIQKTDAVRHTHGFILVVRNKNRSDVKLLLDAPDFNLQILTKFGINCA